MRCPNPKCEQTIPDTVGFCAYCGAKVRQATHALTIQHETVSDLRGLAECSQRHWDYVRRLLYDGTLATWLRTGLFRPADADRAQEIVEREKANQDLGLDRLLRELVPDFPPPQVTVHPASLSGGDIPWQQQRALTCEIRNTGSGCLIGQVRSRAAWLRVEPATFSCVSGRSVPVQITLRTTELDPGQRYQGEIEVLCGNGGQATVPVTVAVPAPQLHITPAVLDLGSGYEGERLTKRLTVQNSGDSAFEAEIIAPVRWLEAQPAHMRVEPGQSASVTVAADTAGMPVGVHTAQVQVIARAGGWQAQAVTPVTAALPKLKTLQYRWGATLDCVAIGVMGMYVLLWALRQLPAGVGFWLGLAQAATWATLLGIGVGFYLAWRKKPAYRRYSGVGAIVVVFVAVIGLGVLWLQPAYRLSCYDQGLALREASEWEQAIAAFAQCGNYRDAPEQQAQVAMAARDWETAVAAAEQLRAVDAARGLGLLTEVYTRQAQAAIAAQDWDTAVTVAEQLRTLDEAQGRTLLVEAYPGQAKTAMAAQEWNAAVTAAEQLRIVDATQGMKLLLEVYTLPEARAVLTQVRPTDRMLQVYVPAGEFEIGSEYGENNERPVHTVTLDGFWLDQIEVTNAQYRRCVEAGACAVSGFADDGRFNGPTQPVVGISWHDAAAYCAWVGGRLPAEAEWEYAAGGPVGRRYPWGNTRMTNLANCRESDCADGYAYTALVGSFPQGTSWVGALDMAGNVREWTADWYGPYPSGSQVNPMGPAAGQYRVERGGSWYDGIDYARISYRNFTPPSNRYYTLGFRCAGNAPGD
ncbi:MAG: SUMF1/EgtB/PvdO family nonheme iron enzyme [Anaerolineae bacterium]|nr:SUMF1/EgtB/PvdO family nonheme iron enzyme [Anaerolineae bacterium]